MTAATDRGKMKTDENLLRRAASRQGLILSKTRRRDPRAIDFGRYALLDRSSGAPVHPDGAISVFALTIDDVRERIATPEETPK